MGQFFLPAKGLCYYGTSTHCTDPPTVSTKAAENFGQAVNSFVYPGAVASGDNNAVGFSSYSVELSSKQFHPGTHLENALTACNLVTVSSSDLNEMVL
jgi:hypothetical protein